MPSISALGPTTDWSAPTPGITIICASPRGDCESPTAGAACDCSTPGVERAPRPPHFWRPRRTLRSSPSTHRPACSSRRPPNHGPTRCGLCIRRSRRLPRPGWRGRSMESWLRICCVISQTPMPNCAGSPSCFAQAPRWRCTSTRWPIRKRRGLSGTPSAGASSSRQAGGRPATAPSIATCGGA